MKNVSVTLLLISSLSTMAQQKKEPASNVIFRQASAVTPTKAAWSSNASRETAATVIAPIQPIVSSKQVVKMFLEEVRSGKAPEKASLFMAETVLAHQLNAENETTVKRTPQNYADHVQEFREMYGNFSFEVTELLAEDDKVYARWKQTGHHLTNLDGFAATGKPLVEIASAVYRVQNSKIVEYWIQIDRLGLEQQLKQQAKE